MKKSIIIFFLFLIAFAFFNIPFNYASSPPPPIQVTIFYSPTCPHCISARQFFRELKKQYPQLSLTQYEVSQNTQRLLTFYKTYKVPASSQGLVPAIFIDQKFFIGFSNQTTTEIKSYFSPTTTKKTPTRTLFDISKLSLPIIAVLFGIMDGFNICSLGALLIILTLVLSLKSRVKMLIFGSSFIFTTAVIYGFLIFFWYQLFHLLSPYLRQMELLIGILTAVGGVYFFKEFIRLKKYGPTCSVSPAQKIEGQFAQKFQLLLENKTHIIPILISIIVFAAIITVIEFPCSAAVPVAFASMLAKAELSSLSYIAHIVLYVLFYMLDELLVFGVAFYSMKLWVASPKFTVWITLIESGIMFALAAYYLFGLL
jgi:glutaredoxin